MSWKQPTGGYSGYDFFSPVIRLYFRQYSAAGDDSVNEVVAHLVRGGYVSCGL